MTFDAIKSFFERYVIWNDAKDLGWYELMWEKVIASGLIEDLPEKDRLRPYLYASALVDFYRSYISEVAGEYWNEEDLTSEDIPKYSYILMCETVGASQITFKDLIEQEGRELLDLPIKNLESLVIENTPDYSALYYEYAFFDYRRRLFSALRKDFSVADMFVLMTYTFYHERFSNNSRYQVCDIGENETIDSFSNMTNGQQFKVLADKSAELFYQDIDLSRGVEWISAVYS